jgi:uncharacterized phage-associated protein
MMLDEFHSTGKIQSGSARGRDTRATSKRIHYLDPLTKSEHVVVVRLGQELSYSSVAIARFATGRGREMALEFRPNLAKIVELLLYLAHKKPGADKYQAVKFFYLADREHLNRYGRPITSEVYFALKYGPVASQAKELLEQNRWTMLRAGLKELPFKIEKVSRPGPDRRELVIIGAPKRNVDLELFSRSDLRVFDQVLTDYGHLDFDALFNLTHKHFAYKKAWASRGQSMRGQMTYEDFIDSAEKRASIVSDIGPVAAHL